ncbi:hypothetical protein ABID39_001619 [Bartonella japonica]|uniref:Uncharacterized protein n=1 Tax=Bartonella japonica TaxID=357761 RepID=A0ABV2FQQ5_9HYPH
MEKNTSPWDISGVAVICSDFGWRNTVKLRGNLGKR